MVSSKEQVEELLSFVDDFKGVFAFPKLLDGLFNIFLAEALDRNESLAVLFGGLFGVLNRDDVSLFKAVGDQFVDDVLLVGLE